MKIENKLLIAELTSYALDGMNYLGKRYLDKKDNPDKFGDKVKRKIHNLDGSADDESSDDNVLLQALYSYGNDFLYKRIFTYQQQMLDEGIKSINGIKAQIKDEIYPNIIESVRMCTNKESTISAYKLEPSVHLEVPFMSMTQQLDDFLIKDAEETVKLLQDSDTSKLDSNVHLQTVKGNRVLQEVSKKELRKKACEVNVLYEAVKTIKEFFENSREELLVCHERLRDCMYSGQREVEVRPIVAVVNEVMRLCTAYTNRQIFTSEGKVDDEYLTAVRDNSNRLKCALDSKDRMLNLD